MSLLYQNKTIYSVLRLIYELLLCILTWTVPKNENLLIFSYFYQEKPSGNLWYLHRYIAENRPDLRCLVIDESGFKNIATIARAKYLLIDHNTGTVFFWGIFQYLSRLKIIQLWHGTGFKQIVFLDDKSKPKGLISLIRYYDKLLRCKKYSCILASSEEDKARKIGSFKNENVFVTGNPKNDIFFDCAISRSNNYILQELGSYGYNRIILYAPTYRDDKVLQPFSSDFWYRLNRNMIDNDDIFIIKKHPYDESFTVPVNHERIIDISEKCSDIQKIMVGADLLITDYSNVAVDFVLTSKPMLFYTFDYDQYIKTCRSFYYDLKQTLPGPFVDCESQLIEYIKDLSWFFEEGYQLKYAAFKNRFHYYQDGNASKRVLQLCLK